jgi:WD40 repeat protein/energy-coupling factor transporter ATP-binding protein EcfA2
VGDQAAWRVLPENPFVGLRPFESDESLLFFGRSAQTMELVERLHLGRFVAVVGSSGCGKSSLVRAGLIPNLKAGFLVNDIDRWNVVTMKPGETPLYSLAEALTAGSPDPRHAADALVTEIRETGLPAILDHVAASSSGSNLLLLVDQFEEIFRSIKAGVRPEQIDDANDFVSMMLRLAEQADLPAYVVLSMRTDFLGDCDAFYGLPEVLNRSQYLVPRLTRQQRRETIEGPISLYQKTVSAGLVDRILNDAGERTDQLPVMQHALMRTWQEFLRDGGGEVGLRHYEACGGIAEALNRHAEQAMEGMPPDREKLTEKIFRALTDTDEHGRRVRRPVLLSQLAAITGGGHDEILAVVDRFQGDNRSFLVLSDTENPGDQMLDISHEALFRQWGRLGRWVEAEAQSKDEYLHIAQRAHLYEKDKDVLMRDPALKVAEEWRARESPTAAWAARYGGDFEAAIRYVDASVAERERERKAREAARARRRRWALAAAVGAFATLLALTGYWWIRAQEAKRAALLQGTSLVEDPLVRALVVTELVKDSFEWEKKSFAETNLPYIQQIATAPIPWAVVGDRNASGLIGAWFEPGGGQIATVSADGVLKRWSSNGKGKPAEFPKGIIPAPLFAAAVSRDRAWLAFSGGDNGAGLIVKQDGTNPHPIPALSGITALAFNPNDPGEILAAYNDHTLHVWKQDGTTVRRLGDDATQPKGLITDVDFDAKGARALSASTDGTVAIWDSRNGRRLAELPGSRVSVPSHSAAFSPDGDWVVCGYDDGSAQIWPSDGKGDPVRLEGHTAGVISVAFSADGTRVITGSKDLRAQIWRLRADTSQSGRRQMRTAGPPLVLSGHTGAVVFVAFSGDGGRAVTVSGDGTARVWWSESREPQVLGRHDDKVQSVAISPDGKRVASSSDDKTAHVWNLDGTIGPGPYPAADFANCVTFDHDGRRVIVGSEDGVFAIWDYTTGSVVRRTDKSAVLSVAFSPDGQRILTGTRYNSASLWAAGAEQGDPLLTFKPEDDWVWRAVFSPIDPRIVTVSNTLGARVWSLDPAGNVNKDSILLGEKGRVLNAVFSRDGSRVATASGDSKARIWDLSNTEKPVGTYLHHDEVFSVAFSSDGNRLLTASNDRNARIWSVEDSVPLLVLPHGSAVRSAVFGPKDSFVVTGSDDGFIRLWHISAADLLQYLANASTACLTTEDRVQFLRERRDQAILTYQSCEAGHGRR